MQSAYVPQPRTWAVGDVVKAPYLRSDVSGAVQLLSQPPMYIGYQTTGPSNSMPSGTDTAISLDTDVYDSLNGHLTTTSPSIYYGMFAGWYLSECSVPLNYTGGAGSLTAGFTASQGGVVTSRLGQCAPNSSGFNTTAACAKLHQMLTVGTYAGASNDYIQLIARQDSGGSPGPLDAINRFPQMALRWVAAPSGGVGLPVPANPAWPTPPTPLSASFLNANVRNAVNFLVYPPIMEAQYLSSGNGLGSQSAVPAAGLGIGLDSVTVDNYGGFSGGSWAAPVAGVYYCYGQVAISALTTTQSMAAGLNVSSFNYNSGVTFAMWGGAQLAYNSAGLPNCAIVRRRLRLNAGDFIQLAGFQRDSSNNTVALLGTGEFNCRMIIVWSGA